MRRILFVDDPIKHEEIDRHKLAWGWDHWEVSISSDAKSAFKILEQQPHDVIVCDIQATGIDATSLLGGVRDRFPDLIRIVLSSRCDHQTTIRIVPLAHQFLLKPCSPHALFSAVNRACTLKATLSNELIRRTVGSIGTLPSLPKTYTTLTKALDDPDVSLAQVGKVIEQDPGLTVKVLRLANSAIFGVAREISSVRHALSYLGIGIVRHLVLSLEVLAMFPLGKHTESFSLETFQDHARLVARIAARLPVPKHLTDAVMVAALLHDVGKLVLASRLPGHLHRCLAVASEQGRPLHVVEQEILGLTHAEIGAYLLALWALPAPMVEAVAHHHHPTRVPADGLDVLAAVYIADTLANEFLPCPSGPDFVHDPIDMNYIEALRAVDELPAWHFIAAEAADEEALVR